MVTRNVIRLAAIVTPLLLVAPAFAADEGGPVSSSALEGIVFYVVAALAVGSAVGIVISKDIVRTAVCLLGTLGSVALIYFLLAANFLGAIQLIVYAGGINVLIVFGVMLTSKSPWIKFTPKLFDWIGGAIVFILLFASLSAAIVATDFVPAGEPIPEPVAVGALGTSLLTSYLVPFELASVLLLVVMIGAAYLARPPIRKKPQR